MDRLEFVEAVLTVFADAECQGDLLYSTRWGDGEIHFSAMCSDVFEWGTADAEDIATPEDVELLRQCLADLNAVGEFGDCYLAELYAARKRRMRPQGAWLAPKRWTHEGADEIRRFFYDAGPERPIDLFNPQTPEGVYAFKP